MIVQKLERRDFIKLLGASAAAVPGVSGLILGMSENAEAKGGTFAPNLFVSIDKSGAVQIVCHRSEMGQGARTSMLMLVAEELEVDPKEVKLIQAPGDERYGDQNTDGSTSARKNWVRLREFGAAAREMLEFAAAEAWKVTPNTCKAKKGFVVHTMSGRKLSYGDLAERAAKQPIPKKPKLKSTKAFQLVGKPRSGIDVDDMTRGRATFGIDVRIPEMVYASIERSPTIWGRPKSYDEKAAMKIPGVLHVESMRALPQDINTNYGVAVVATNTWAAIKGREALKVSWNPGKSKLETSTTKRKKMEYALERATKSFRNDGDAVKARKRAAKTVASVYETPYLVHAPMEPLNATAKVTDKRCEVWAPTQDPQRARKKIAEFLGFKKEQVDVHVTLLGGGFGRKSQPDFVLEAVALSKMVNRPVQVVWTREDEVKHGFYHAQSCQKITAGIDSKGRVISWEHKSVFPTIQTVFNPKARVPAEWEIGMGAVEMPYRIANVSCQTGPMNSDVRVGWLRAVCHVFHAFGINSFTDELAHTLKKDPIELRLELLGKPRVIPGKRPNPFDTKRLINVINVAKKKSRWRQLKLAESEGVGFAAHYSFFSYVAAAIRARVKGQAISVEEVDCVIDCGQMINPDSVRAQMEGAVAFGLSLALYGEITLKDGVVQQGNFDDYQLLRMPEMPKVNVHLIDSDEPPMGVGEPGVPPIAPALAGAIFHATGKRLRSLPLRLG